MVVLTFAKKTNFTKLLLKIQCNVSVSKYLFPKIDQVI